MVDFARRPILDVAVEHGLEAFSIAWGRDKAKVGLEALQVPPRGEGRLVLVTAINPTPAGEGKTTTSVALAMGMRRLGKKAVLALREPSLGPVFGVKGGGTGGGKASLVPADDINLHFTGDIHAITSAHNLLSALVDNALHFRQAVPVTGGAPRAEIDPRQVRWGRALDINDRFLRHCVVGLGGKAHGVPREERFDITAASEVMAVLALAESHADLRARLGRIVVAATTSGAAVTAEEVGAAGAMTALLRDALLPNLVQTAEGGAALVHTGPFGNIAHGCNSVLATRLAMHLGDYAVTEAGFGFDLGGEKFLDIKCRQMGVWPRVAVLVVTLRALRMHGGLAVKEASRPDAAALQRGVAHLERHLASLAGFGLPAVVAINVFPGDTEDELRAVEAASARLGAACARSEGFARGGEGAVALAQVVADAADATDASPPVARYAYEAADPPEAKMEKVARAVYGADGVDLTARAKADLARARTLGAEKLPVCMAKTQLSLTDDPSRHGAPTGFRITVREVRVSAGAGFLVPLTGDMLTMPGLPREPAAWHVELQADGSVRGLMQGD